MSTTLKNHLEDLFDYVLEKNKTKNYNHTIRKKKGKPNPNKQELTYDYFAYLAQKPTGKSVEKPPIYHKNIILAYAFNAAHNNVFDLKSEMRLDSNNPDRRGNPTNTEYPRPNKEMALYEFINNRNKEALQKIKRLADSSEINDFYPMALKLYKLLWGCRNYFSHYFHEQGVLGYTDMPSAIPISNPDQQLTPSEWEEVRIWIKARFDDTQNNMIRSLQENKERNKDDKKAVQQIDEATDRIKEVNLFDANNIFTEDGLLFTVCMFLRKSQASYVIRKWNGIKKTEGFYKTVGTFFTAYSVTDKYSLLSEHDNMRSFRRIVSLLSNLPYIDHPDMQVFYNKVEECNKQNEKDIEQAENKIRIKNGLIREEKKKWHKKDANAIQKYDNEIISLKAIVKNLKDKFMRRRNHANITHWLLRYLQDRGLLNTIEIAYHKDVQDYIDEKTKLFDEKTLMVYKMETKYEQDKEKKKQRNENIRAFKRNFTFKTPEAGNYRFCIKKKNALTVIPVAVNGNIIKVQVVISPKILTKWVFVDLMNNKNGNKVLEDIKSYLSDYCTTLQNTQAKDIQVVMNNIKNVRFTKAFPQSLRQNFDSTVAEQKNKTKATDEEIYRNIGLQKQAIDNFIALNKAKEAPWKYASRKKINWIFDYIHFTYLVDAYTTGKTDDEIRHECLREDTYLQAFEFIRFYRKNRTSKEFKEFFSIPYFNHIRPRFGNVEKLELLFENCLKGKGGYWDRLNEISITDDNRTIYARIFKIHKYAESENIEKNMKPIFLKNVSLPPECVSIKNYSVNIGNIKLSNFSNKTEFSDIRHSLEQTDAMQGITNIDYIIQNIYPLVLQDKETEKEILKENGKKKRAIINNFLKVKTDELLLWNIAKHYWYQTYNEKYKIDRPETIKVKGLPYKKNLFNVIFQKDLIIPILNIKSVNKPKPIYTTQNKKCYLQISAKKFDDEYQYFESTYLNDYIKWYYSNDKTKVLNREDNNRIVLSYTKLNQNIKSRLVLHLDDIYLILQTEKSVLLRNRNTFKNNVVNRYYNILNRQPGQNQILIGFYQKFDESIKPYFVPIINQNDFEELKKVRNKALHYQLQNPLPYANAKRKLINYLRQQTP